MSSIPPVPFKAALMALVTGLGMSYGAEAVAGEHYISMSKIFPVGKCSAVIPNFELMVSHFTGGELTEHRILDERGEMIEVITTFINKQRDQWATVGLRRDDQVIFCLYASGTGPGSVNRRGL